MSFECAPVTKGLIIASALSSLVVGLFDVKHYFHLQLVPHISIHHQYWRLLVHHFAFANSSDVFLAEILLYHLGIPVERQFGSWKFASFAFITTMVATILEFLGLLLFHPLGFNHIPAGPLTLIFAILYQHTRIIPSVYSFRVFGLSLSNDSFHHFLALQLAIGQFPSSILPCVVGFACGLMYRSDLVNLKQYRISPRMSSLSRHYLLPLLGTTHPERRSNRAIPDEPRSDTFESLYPRENDEVVTTARPSTSSPSVRGRRSPAPRNPGTSVVREWVDGIAGLDRRNRGLPRGMRVPTDSEISHLTTMFPELGRDVLVATLQRSSTTTEAVETLLSTSSVVRT